MKPQAVWAKRGREKSFPQQRLLIEELAGGKLKCIKVPSVYVK
jgi:hypothetical protein